MGWAARGAPRRSPGSPRSTAARQAKVAFASGYYQSFWGYYGYGWSQATVIPIGTRTTTTIGVETLVYDVTSDRLGLPARGPGLSHIVPLPSGLTMVRLGTSMRSIASPSPLSKASRFAGRRCRVPRQRSRRSNSAWCRGRGPSRRNQPQVSPVRQPTSRSAAAAQSPWQRRSP